MNEEATAVLTAPTTRRKIVKTGVKVAYAAPLVAASFKLTAKGAAAQLISVSGGCTNVFTCGGGEFGCGGSDSCYCDLTTEGTTVCDNTGTCSHPCGSTSECPSGSHCVTNTCCSGPVCISLCGTPELPSVDSAQSARS